MNHPNYDLIVLGGGPAGATAATLAAKGGLRVLLLEAGEYPRFKIGESMLPGITPILAELGVLEAMYQLDFARKTGVTHWNWGKTPEFDFWFADNDYYDHSWFVEREKFDDLLFQNALKQPTIEAHQHAKATRLLWDGDRLRGVEWTLRGSQETRTALAPMTIDATGQAAIIASEFSNIEPLPGFKHLAYFAHYEGVAKLPSPREHQGLFIAEKNYWTWIFPVSSTRTSIGCVFFENEFLDTEMGRADAFDQMIASSPTIQRAIGPEAHRVMPVRVQRDWSYRNLKVCGPSWMCAGDSSGFIDPVLSTGVFQAMHAGRNAAKVVLSLAQGEIDEAAALQHYEETHQKTFNDLIRVLRAFYNLTLELDDYFWESKKILNENGYDFKPRKCFMMLVSGLMNNLAFVDKSDKTAKRRSKVTDHQHKGIKLGVVPTKLDFVGFHLKFQYDGAPRDLYFLLEPADSSEPTFGASLNWHLNALAPRILNNHPVQIPIIEQYLRLFIKLNRHLDTVSSQSLAEFWGQHHGQLLDFFRLLPPEFEFVRAFGD